MSDGVEGDARSRNLGFREGGKTQTHAQSEQDRRSEEEKVIHIFSVRKKTSERVYRKIQSGLDIRSVRVRNDDCKFV